MKTRLIDNGIIICFSTHHFLLFKYPSYENDYICSFIKYRNLTKLHMYYLSLRRLSDNWHFSLFSSHTVTQSLMAQSHERICRRMTRRFGRFLIKTYPNCILSDVNVLIPYEYVSERAHNVCKTCTDSTEYTSVYSGKYTVLRQRQSKVHFWL